MKNTKKFNLTLSLVLIALSVLLILLEILPYGALLRFANADGDPIIQTYSYFDLTPYGYANFGPFMTAVVSCVLFVVELIALLTQGKQLFAPITIVSATMLFCSLLPLFFGVGTWLGGIISCVALAKVAIAAYGRVSLKWADERKIRRSNQS